MAPFLKGMMLALVLTMNVGPGLILQFNASINRGFYAGLNVVGGLYSANVCLIGLSYLGASYFLEKSGKNIYMGLPAALVFIVFGLMMFLKKADEPARLCDEDPFRKREPFFFFIKAFLMNLTNPFNLIFWLGLIGMAGNHFTIHSAALYSFLGGIFFAAVSIDVIKCYLFSKLHRFFNPVLLKWINRAMGILLCLIGAGILLKLTLSR